jgi:hypothetical protein
VLDIEAPLATPSLCSERKRKTSPIMLLKSTSAISTPTSKAGMEKSPRPEENKSAKGTDAAKPPIERRKDISTASRSLSPLRQTEVLPQHKHVRMLSKIP